MEHTLIQRLPDWNKGLDKIQNRKDNCHVIFELNLIDVPIHTWWLDSGATTHVSHSLKGFTTRRAARPEEKLYLGTEDMIQVELVGTFRLILSSGHVLDLEETFYVPSLRRNLISISRLLPFGYDVNFRDSGCDVNIHGESVGSALLVDDLFRLILDVSYEKFLSGVSSSHNVLLASAKRSRIFLQSSMLWHQRLGHISKEKLHSLVKKGVLGPLDFSDFSTCLDCI